MIDMHMNIATAVLDQIKSRKLDMFFESEEQIMGKQVSGEGHGPYWEFLSASCAFSLKKISLGPGS